MIRWATTSGTGSLQPAFLIVAAATILSAFLRSLSGALDMDSIASHRTFRFRDAAGRYREARRSLHTPASARSRRGLDWMNFFIADVQTGFGSFVAFYLAQSGWSSAHIGIALSVGAIGGHAQPDSGRCACRCGHLEARPGGGGIVMTAVGGAYSRARART